MSRRFPHACSVLLVFVLCSTTMASEPAPTDLFDHHWQRPLPEQGEPPPGFTALEASLDARSCAVCHPQQYLDWQQSRHRQTLQAGLLWQFQLLTEASANRCLDCHAPLAEQKALLAGETGWSVTAAKPSAAHIPADLHRQGLTCAACHLRKHVRYGPEHRAGLRGDEAGLAHGGFTTHPDFRDSRFCAGCHQFPEDGARLNGKLRQDTYNQWLASEYAERDIHCQDCHMPNRRHHWHGVNSREGVLQALRIDLTSRQDEAGQLHWQLRLANVGAGHHFPAYMASRFDVRLHLLDDSEGEEVELLHHIIQWRGDDGLRQELFDHRLPAGASLERAGTVPLAGREGAALSLRIDATPKEHYERLYRQMLQLPDSLSATGRELLELALQEAVATRYRVIETRITAGEGFLHDGSDH